MSSPADFWNEYAQSGIFIDEPPEVAQAAGAPAPPDDLVQFVKGLFRAKVVKEGQYAGTSRRRRQSA